MCAQTCEISNAFRSLVIIFGSVGQKEETLIIASVGAIGLNQFIIPNITGDGHIEGPGGGVPFLFLYNFSEHYSLAVFTDSVYCHFWHWKHIRHLTAKLSTGWPPFGQCVSMRLLLMLL